MFQSLFKHVADTEDENVTCRIDLSYYEIYNERVRDLLQPDLLKQNENYSLKIREHPRDGPYVKGSCVCVFEPGCGKMGLHACALNVVLD